MVIKEKLITKLILQRKQMMINPDPEVIFFRDSVDNEGNSSVRKFTRKGDVFYA